MTTTVGNTEHRLAQIHETAYWRVIIHPTDFKEHRISTLRDCWQIIQQSQVSLRPGGYPYVDDQEKICNEREGWVQSGTAWGNEIELWRFYQSGQFVHHLAAIEDRESPPLGWQGPDVSPRVEHPREVNYHVALHTITEVLLFAGSLTFHGSLEPAVTIRIELRGVKGRRLISPTRPQWRDRYVAHADSIVWEQTLLPIALLADASSLALDAAIRMFGQFNWSHPSRAVLEKDQRRFLEGRL